MTQGGGRSDTRSAPIAEIVIADIARDRETRTSPLIDTDDIDLRRKAISSELQTLKKKGPGVRRTREKAANFRALT